MGLKSSFTTVKGCVTLYWELKPTLSSSQYFLNPIKSLWPGVFQNKTQINQMYLVMRVDTPNMGMVGPPLDPYPHLSILIIFFFFSIY